MLEKIDGAIKNGQCIIGHKTQNEDKQNKNTRKTQKMNNMVPTKKPGVNTGAHER